MEDNQEHSADKTEENNSKITSVVKEKIKDPRRVAQGKKLAAISRQAKERKAREREAAAKEKWVEEECFLSKSSNGYIAIIPVILFGGYYVLYLRSVKTEDNIQEDRKDPKREQKPTLEKL